MQYQQGIACRNDMPFPPQIAFGCGCSLPCCHLLNAFEVAARANHRHLTNGTESENGTDRQTDRWTDGRIAALLNAHTIGRGHKTTSHSVNAWSADVLTTEETQSPTDIRCKLKLSQFSVFYQKRCTKLTHH